MGQVPDKKDGVIHFKLKPGDRVWLMVASYICQATIKNEFDKNKQKMYTLSDFDPPHYRGLQEEDFEAYFIFRSRRDLSICQWMVDPKEAT